MIKKISIVNKITKQENEPFTVNPFQVPVGLGQDFVTIFKSIGSLFSLIGLFHLKWELKGKKVWQKKVDNLRKKLQTRGVSDFLKDW